MNQENHIVTVESPEGERTFNVQPDTNLWYLLMENGIIFDSDCGGRAHCKSCKVTVKSGDQINNVSACSVNVDESIHVTIPNRNRKHPKWALLREPSGPLLFGIDLGTTSIGLYLANINGNIVASTSLQNPQVTRGFDVVSRLSAAREPTVRMLLGESLRKGVVDRLQLLESETEIQLKQIRSGVMVGGGATVLLALGLDSHAMLHESHLNMLANNPSFELNGNTFGLLNKTPITVLPPVNGFLGSDATIGAWAVELHHSSSPKAYIDLSTNGNVILNDGKKFWGTTAVEGSAFDGGKLTFGMNASNGALVKLDFPIPALLRPQTVGGMPLIGICGSGFVSIISHLLNQNLLDDTGRLHQGKNVVSHGSQLAWVVPQREKSAEPILVTQDDIREFQLAKGTVAAALEILLTKAGIKAQDLSEIIVAGSYGVRWEVDELKQLGIIPASVEATSIRNSAGKGAIKCLGSKRNMEGALHLIDHIEYVNLDLEPEYENITIRHLALIKHG